MAEVEIADALDGAQFVKADVIAGYTVVQVWHGGTQVQVYMTRTGWECTWEEVDVWTLSDQQGEAPSQAAIEQHMEMHAEAVGVEAEMKGAGD